MHSPRGVTRVGTMYERAEPWGWDRGRGAAVDIVSPTTVAGVFGDSEDGMIIGMGQRHDAMWRILSRCAADRMVRGGDAVGSHGEVDGCTRGRPGGQDLVGGR